jgi:hypothetical protein
MPADRQACCCSNRKTICVHKCVVQKRSTLQQPAINHPAAASNIASQLISPHDDAQNCPKQEHSMVARTSPTLRTTTSIFKESSQQLMCADMTQVR